MGRTPVAVGSEGSNGLITAEQVAVLIGLSTSSCYRHAAAGVLPCVRFGNSIRFDPEAVKAAWQKRGDRVDPRTVEVLSLLAGVVEELVDWIAGEGGRSRFTRPLARAQVLIEDLRQTAFAVNNPPAMEAAK